MKSRLYPLVARKEFLIMLIALGYSCAPIESINPQPTIVVTTEDPNINRKQLNGSVMGINPSQFNLVVYAKINEFWFTMHDKNFPVIPISDDLHWVCNLMINEGEEFAELTIFLIPNGYAPPIITGAKIIPVKMNLVAIAKQSIVLREDPK